MVSLLRFGCDSEPDAGQGFRSSSEAGVLCWVRRGLAVRESVASALAPRTQLLATRVALEPTDGVLVMHRPPLFASVRVLVRRVAESRAGDRRL